MDIPGDDNVKWSKSEIQAKILYGFSYMKHPKYKYRAMKKICNLGGER